MTISALLLLIMTAFGASLLVSYWQVKTTDFKARRQRISRSDVGSQRKHR